eukprot:TRINITY_DN5384_c0_g1_i2.p1 TRINITY_DN5384_c0_g1~~TRINITY_DN5384_c0_g1_i2.p1  ORF type:complete len:115 (-),score=39.80 TRINITY_DN5384_c0_g1_i2:476-820(-)
MQSIQDFIHPSDVDFFAEDEKITIEPNFNMEAVTFISGTLGPFKTLQKTEVPLWLAVELKQKRKCNIVIPSWLTVSMYLFVYDSYLSLSPSLSLSYLRRRIINLLIFRSTGREI